jgi:hypothetical protein
MTQQFKWKRSPKKKHGVLCGAERSQEWLIPWWWSRYAEHNAYPITFCDFGMSEEMRGWCAERGEVVRIEFDLSYVTPRSGIDDELARKWESAYRGSLWNARRTWFQKPFAFLESPYERGIWIDLDCEVLGSLEPLFCDFIPSSELALVRDYTTEHFPRLGPLVLYNGGVVVFNHSSSILESWAEGSVTKNHLFISDDHLLSHLIHTYQLEVQELPEEYNWRMVRGLNLGVVIIHWVGSSGKAYIRTHGGLKPSLDAFFQSCKGKH